MVYFSLRESKQNKKGLSPIEVSITTNGKRIYFSTGKHVPAADWNKEKQAVKGKSEEAQLINGYLIQLRNKIYQKEIELLPKGYLITAELLKEAITDKVEALNEKTLLDVLNEHNTERKAMVGKTVAPATYWVFEYTGRLFKEFIQKKDMILKLRKKIDQISSFGEEYTLTDLKKVYAILDCEKMKEDNDGF